MARELGIRQVLIHPDAGVLSALGTGWPTSCDIVRAESNARSMAIHSLSSTGSSMGCEREAVAEVRRRRSAIALRQAVHSICAIVA